MTVDAGEVPCEFSVADDFTTAGVDEETVAAILAGKTCAEKSQLVRRSSPRDGRTFQKGDKWRCRFVATKFRHDDPNMEGLYTSGNTPVRPQTGRLVDMHAVQHGYSVLCLDVENAYFHAEEDEEVY